MEDIDDIFDSLLSLESVFYKEGYNEGLADGLRSGRSEGKQFGLQTGFQRFLSVGILQGRCRIWKQFGKPQSQESQKRENTNSAYDQNIITLQSSSTDNRSMKQLQVLETLVSDISIENTEEAVEEFENRIKRARTRAKIVASMFKDPTPVQYETDAVQVLGKGETDDELAGIDAVSSSTHSHYYDHASEQRAAMEIEIV
ncbi:DUF1715-domain-containing protein [Dipodascopsis uninucleata]